MRTRLDDGAHKSVRGADDGAHWMETRRYLPGVNPADGGGGGDLGVPDSALSSNIGPKKGLAPSDLGGGGGLLHKKGPAPSAVRSYPKP